MLKLKTAFVLIFMSAFLVLAHADEDRTITGVVTDVEWLDSSLTVRYHEPLTGSIDEITVKVPKDAALTRGTKTITFSDIRQSDRVTLTYYSDDLSGFKVRRLHDQNMGNR